MGLTGCNADLRGSADAPGGNPCAGVFLALAMLTASGAMAQNLPAFPPGAEQHEAQLMQRMGPQARAWIAQEAHRDAAQPELSEQMAVARVRANFAVLGNLGDGDVMAIAFVVMMEAAKSAQDDLKSIMAGVKSINEAKARARQNQKKVRSDVAASQHGIQSSGDSVAIVRKPSTATSRAVISARPLPKAQLDSQIDKAKNDPDSLSEMSDEQTLRMQMAMDRISKAMSAVSNMMKKTSDTQSTIIKNMK